MSAHGGDWDWMIDASTLIDLIEARAAETPDATLFIDDADQRMTCSEFREAVERAAMSLAARGIKAGTHVAWQLPTKISTYIVMVALRRLGAVQAPIIPNYREREVTQALVAARAEHFLVPGTWNGFDFEAMALSLELPPGVTPLVTVVDAGLADLLGGDQRPSDNQCDPDAVTWLYFTSGSSGPLKAVRHTDDTLINAGRGFAGRGRLGELPDEVGAVAFPIAHVGGVMYLIAALAGGFPVLLLESFVPVESVALMRRHSVTTTGGAPPFYQAILAVAQASDDPRSVLPTLRTLKGGGAACSSALFHQVLDVLGVIVAHDYGMTEIPLIAGADPTDPVDQLAATDGAVVPGNEVRVVTAVGKPCPPGSVGEIQVHGRGVCRGYVDHEAAARAFTADGWFRTGDLAVQHPSGYVEVVGRIRDVIIRKGENVVPAELEDLLAARPEIAEVAVIGLPDEERGEIVCAVLVPAAGHGAPTLAEVQDMFREAGLMKQKWPERVEILDQLPRTGLAKVAKQDLKQRFQTSVPTN